MWKRFKSISNATWHGTAEGNCNFALMALQKKCRGLCVSSQSGSVSMCVCVCVGSGGVQFQKIPKRKFPFTEEGTENH